MFRYPVEVVAETYLSRVGGFSEEIERGEIGINSKALEVNTSIIANVTVADLRFFGERKPYYLRRKFVIVGVDENMDAYDLTRNGEVVLPEDIRDELAEIAESVEGREVIINTVESFRVDGDYSKVVEAVLWRMRSISGIRERRN